MRLVYDSVKPRRVEVVVFQGDTFDVPDRIGEQLRTISGFKPDEGEKPAVAAKKTAAKKAAKKTAAKKAAKKKSSG